MPAPNMSAQSPPARRHERAERQHVDKRDRLAMAATGSPRPRSGS